MILDWLLHRWYAFRQKHRPTQWPLPFEPHPKSWAPHQQKADCSFGRVYLKGKWGEVTLFEGPRPTDFAARYGEENRRTFNDLLELRCYLIEKGYLK